MPNLSVPALLRMKLLLQTQLCRIKVPSREADRGLSSIVSYAMQVSQQCIQCTPTHSC